MFGKWTFLLAPYFARGLAQLPSAGNGSSPTYISNGGQNATYDYVIIGFAIRVELAYGKRR